MTIPTFYPGAVQLMNGVGTGTWNGSGPWKLLLHTTETRGVPGYQDGQLAPHITWGPRSGKFYQHFPLTGPSEALSTFDDDMVIQVEMICYSAKNIADEVGGLWVGNLTPEQLEQLAGFCRWVMGHLNIPAVWPKKQALSYTAANATGFRMSAEVFKAWSGLLGHQHAPFPNRHWDPGAFPWTRFMPLLQPEDEMTPEQEQRILDAIAGVDEAVWAKPLKQWGDFIAQPPAEAGLLLGQTHANAWNATKQTSRTALLSVLEEADDDDLAAIAVAVADEQARRLQA